MTNTSSCNLYIITTSDNPDIYINTIGFCIDHYEINKVFLIGVVKDKGQKLSNETKLEQIKNSIIHQTTKLQDGKYLYRNQKTKQLEEKIINIDTPSKSRYARIADKKIETRVIFYDNLENEINIFIKENNNRCIFDVSGALKGLLIDTYTILQMKGNKNIFVFELKLQKRTFDEKELIHNLSLDRGDYEFINFTESDYTKNIKIKTLDQDKSDTFRSSALEEAIEFAAEQNANTVLLLYLAVIITSITIFIIFVLRDQWQNLEPWTFILMGPLVPYLLDLVSQIIFRKDFSIKPSFIREILIDRSRKKIHKKIKI